MGLSLRPYQLEAVDAIEREWEAGHARTLLVLPTGCGKTICFSEVARRQAECQNKTLILAHRGELLEQAADKLKRATGLDSALEKADSHAAGSSLPVIVGSIQTMMRTTRLDEFGRDAFNTIIVDEAHHVMSDSYQRVLGYFESAHVLGVTATPDRADMKNLGEYFDSLAYEYKLSQAIKEGYLCRMKAQTIPLKIDLTEVRTQQGDYAAGDLGHALEPYLEEIADVIAEKYADRKTVVFLPLVSISQEFCRMLADRGMEALEVNGNSKDRAEVLEQFDGMKKGILCNSMLLTEGWDCPSVDCIVVLRPTKVRSLYCQMIGRGTRLCEGKDHLLILDFLWHTTRHDLCRPTCLICKTPETAAHIETRMDNGEEIELNEDTEKQAADNVKEQRENALAKLLAEQRRKKARLVDPLQFEMSILEDDLREYTPTFEWELMDPTEKQLQALEKFGMNPEAIREKGKGYACMLMDKLIKRRENGLTTPKQIRCLERFGFRNVGGWQFEEANKMIGWLATHNWFIPYDKHPELFVPKSLR